MTEPPWYDINDDPPPIVWRDEKGWPYTEQALLNRAERLIRKDMEMGFCSGTQIFDDVVSTLIDAPIPPTQIVNIIIALTDALEDHDWDCQDDSDYWDEPLVREAFREVHPDWDWLFEDA